MASNIVPTTKKVADAILNKIPASCWSDPEWLFLDICSKNGTVLTEAFNRLDKGLSGVISDAEERKNHILGRQLAALCPTKEAQESTIDAVFGEAFKDRAFFEPSVHHWDSNGVCRECGMKQKSYNGRSDVDAYCGLHKSDSQSQWLRQIAFGKKIAIATDPVFNLPLPSRTDSKTHNIYPKYVEAAIAMRAEYVAMVIPAKWMAAKNGTAGHFRQWMTSGRRISSLEWFENARELFDESQLKGGACIFLWNRNWNSRECQFISHGCGASNVSFRRVSLQDGCVYGRKEEMELASIIERKIEKNWIRTADSLYNAPMAFNLQTNFASSASAMFPNAVKIYERNDRVGYVEEGAITKGKELLKSWKVAVKRSYGTGVASKDKLTAIVVEPGACTTASWVTFGPFTKEQAETFCRHLNTSKYARACVGLAKRTQDTSRKVYRLLPVKGLTDKDWNDEKFKEWMGIPEELHKYVMTAY